MNFVIEKAKPLGTTFIQSFPIESSSNITFNIIEIEKPANLLREKTGENEIVEKEKKQIIYVNSVMTTNTLSSS